MHAAAHWAAFTNFFLGNTVVIQSDTRRLDPHDLLGTAERERVQMLLIVGDAFATPLLEQLGRRSYDLSNLRFLINGGAALNAAHKRALLERFPRLRIIDSIGSSESGHQGQHVSSREQGAATGGFQPTPGTCVLSEDLTRVLKPGDPELGWFARTGRTPLGYLGDPAKTARTFPVVDGVTYSVPGDRARQRSDGVIEVHGRDSVTINSGGEKIFAEEVEQVIRAHPAVYDAVVVGRASERWGQEVVALVKLRPGARLPVGELRDFCASQIARYKLPKAVLFLDEIVRSPSGKPDYRWAKAQVET
jgi:fatty-acyl-CoA synthase